MITLHIFTNADQTEFTAHTYEDVQDALYAVNHVQDITLPNVEQHLTPFGFKIYNDEGLCFHSNDGEAVGEVLAG